MPAIEQNNMFAYNPALAMLQTRNKYYICTIGSQASAADVTCGKMAFGREMNNFTLFFLYYIVQIVLTSCTYIIQINNFFYLFYSYCFNYLTKTIQLIDCQLSYTKNNVNYRTNSPCFLYLFPLCSIITTILVLYKVYILFISLNPIMS